MNKKVFLIAIILGATTFVISCDEEDPIAKPEITIMELGEGDSHGNDHTAVVGGDVHIEAEIIAEGKIDWVQVRIHPEGEHEEEGEHNGEHEEWEIDTTYTKFSGLKNTTFHEHLEIDASADPGEYHFDFVVTDMEGNQSSAEAELQINEN